MERSIEKHRDVYTCFIDYSKAFDTVKHELLVELLQSLDVDKSETKLLTNLFWKHTSVVGVVTTSVNVWISNRV